MTRAGLRRYKGKGMCEINIKYYSYLRFCIYISNDARGRDNLTLHSLKGAWQQQRRQHRRRSAQSDRWEREHGS